MFWLMMKKKRYGGEMKDLNKNSDYELPLELELIFDNKKLDMFEYIVIIFLATSQFKKRSVSIEQMVYYYTIFFSLNSKSKTPLIYKYNKDMKKIGEYLISLSSLKLIEVIGTVDQPLSRIKVKLTNYGKEFIESIESETLLSFISDIANVMKKYSYDKNSPYLSKILYEGWTTNEN